ncbi:MAG: hypothetical protein HQL94_11055, partial [Magnetococcales bacterium]|nr:hypothetical protein [Magnetococcales bacterium]
MNIISDPTPVLLIDIVGFSNWNRQEELENVVKRLQSLLDRAFAKMIDFADPVKLMPRHGTGDGYYLFFNSLPSPAAMRVAIDFEPALKLDNANYPDYPLRLRLALAFGEVRMVGDQWSGQVLIEAARLIDDARVKKLMEDEPNRLTVVVASRLFWNDWFAHKHKNNPKLAIPV